MSQSNMTTLLSYHNRSMWFYKRSSAIFEQKFHEFQSKFCSSLNCTDEIEELREENRKLEESCGVQRLPVKRFANIYFDWEKMNKNESLALRCLSYGIRDGFTKQFDIYNKHIREKNKDIVGRILKDWIKVTLQNLFISKNHFGQWFFFVSFLTGIVEDHSDLIVRNSRNNR